MRISKNDIEDFPRFSLVSKDYFVADSLCFFTGKELLFLLGILNSEFAKYYFFNNVAILDDGGMQMRQQFIELIPIPKVKENKKKIILDLVSEINNNNHVENKLNDMVYSLYDFNQNEIKHIKSFIYDKIRLIKG